MCSRSDEDTCEEFCGHDDVWFDSVGTQTERSHEEDNQQDIVKLSSELAFFKKLVTHLQWRCVLYRKALKTHRVPFTLLDKNAQQGALCLSCEKDELITELANARKRIVELESEMSNTTSPILGRTATKRRKADNQVN